jgi:hypothetical protein
MSEDAQRENVLRFLRSPILVTSSWTEIMETIISLAYLYRTRPCRSCSLSESSTKLNSIFMERTEYLVNSPSMMVQCLPRQTLQSVSYVRLHRPRNFSLINLLKVYSLLLWVRRKHGEKTVWFSPHTVFSAVLLCQWRFNSLWWLLGETPKERDVRSLTDEGCVAP